VRYIGLILALGTICWVLYQAAGGGEAETVIPVEQQRALDTAKGVEQSMQDASKKSMEEAEKKSGL
jgi:ABC-type microcin C transport system permease subunit YejB